MGRGANGQPLSHDFRGFRSGAAGKPGYSAAFQVARGLIKIHPGKMIGLFFLASASVADPTIAIPVCVPVATDQLKPTTSDIEEHRALRQAMHEPMPNVPPMVMLHGKGGHLATQEYSIIVARNADGLWRGTAVGRSQVSVKDAPYTSMKRAAWVLDKDTAQRLEDAISRICPIDRIDSSSGANEPPPRYYIPKKSMS
jgi:hypothetical protein